MCLSHSRDALARLDGDEKGIRSIDTLGGRQEMSVVNAVKQNKGN